MQLHNLFWAQCTTTEQGVTQDYKEAAKWVLKAAEQGNARAQFNLGLMQLNLTPN